VSDVGGGGECTEAKHSPNNTSGQPGERKTRYAEHRKEEGKHPSLRGEQEHQQPGFGFGLVLFGFLAICSSVQRDGYLIAFALVHLNQMFLSGYAKQQILEVIEQGMRFFRIEAYSFVCIYSVCEPFKRIGHWCSRNAKTRLYGAGLRAQKSRIPFLPRIFGVICQPSARVIHTVWNRSLKLPTVPSPADHA